MNILPSINETSRFVKCLSQSTEKDYIFNALENYINTYKHDGIVISCDDFNSRTEVENDFVSNVNIFNPLCDPDPFNDLIKPGFQAALAVTIGTDRRLL